MTLVDNQVVPVEAETQSVVEEVIEPGKDAFAAGKDEPPPAPKSGVADPELFAQAASAHAEAEKKEEGVENAEASEKVRESEPTNLPGPERPVEVLAEAVRDKQEEDVVKEAPVPLEEAAPTPSSSTPAVPVASIADPEEKAGAQMLRLAQIDDTAVKAGLPELEAQEHAEVNPVQAEHIQEQAEEPHLPLVLVKEGEEVEPDAQMDMVPSEEEKIQVEEDALKHKLQVQLDPDALAAEEERQRHRVNEAVEE